MEEVYTAIIVCSKIVFYFLYDMIAKIYTRATSPPLFYMRCNIYTLCKIQISRPHPDPLALQHFWTRTIRNIIICLGDIAKRVCSNMNDLILWYYTIGEIINKNCIPN